MEYPVETFTEAEIARLAPHVTSLDEPVFALVNLPETVKGALFARYSRYQGTLRRLFLDEFADSLPQVEGGAFDGDEGERAAQLYERIFVGYGDDYIWTGSTKPLQMTPSGRRRRVKLRNLRNVRRASGMMNAPVRSRRLEAYRCA